jgi:hypothetical protein
MARIGIRIGSKPVIKSFAEKVDGVIEAVFDIAEMKKAGGHKYVKREGSTGNFKYYYKLPDGSIGTKEDLKAAKNGKKPDDVKTPGNKQEPKKLGIKKPEDAKNQGSGKPAEPAKRVGIRKPRQEEKNIGNGTGFAGSVAEGDSLTGKDAYTGQSITGKVSHKGKDGITIETENGIIHKIRWEGVQKVHEIVNDRDAIRILYNKEAIEGGWRGGDDSKQPESCDSIGGLLKAAEADRENLNKLTGEYAANFAGISPIVIKRPVLKGIDRIKEKLRDDEKESVENGDPPGEFYDKETDTYHCRTIRDTDGHTITLNTVTDIGKLLEAFDKDKRIVRIKNNFAKPTPLGYSDINMNVRLPNGTIAEMQLNTTANLVAKERYGHSMYEVYRTINGMEGNIREKHAELLELMIEGQKALYKKANEFSKEGTYTLSGSVQSEIGNGNAGAIFKEENQEYAGIIKPFIEKALPLLEEAVNDGLFPKTEKGEENKAIGHFRDLAERIKTA